MARISRLSDSPEFAFKGPDTGQQLFSDERLSEFFAQSADDFRDT
jgi:hypothetical protein